MTRLKLKFMNAVLDYIKIKINRDNYYNFYLEIENLQKDILDKLEEVK